MLAPMKYRDFTWPQNPATFEVELRRTLHSYKIPFSGFSVQNLGMQNRVFKRASSQAPMPTTASAALQKRFRSAAADGLSTRYGRR